MKYQFWFVVGSQNLYGPEVLKGVNTHATKMTNGFNNDANNPFEIISKDVVKTPEEITKVMMQANADKNCARGDYMDAYFLAKQDVDWRAYAA